MFSLIKLSILAGVTLALPRHNAQANYAHRIFHDFRSLDGSLYSKPANITNDEESAAATVQPGYLTSDAWVNDFDIQTWGAPVTEDTPVQRSNSNANVYLDGNDGPSTHLVLRAYRNADFISTAEVRSKVHNIFYASIRVRARVHGNPGACAGIFTYYDDNDESDVEILTRNPPNHIHYTNQPAVDENGNKIPGASTELVMPRGAVWTEWNDHRLDWTAGLSSWYLNGELVHTKTYGVPSNPSTFMVNMWGNGGMWTGEMDIEAAAYLEIEWIEILYTTA
ncbi:concanavalin A-like lectin/glucanase domain-containing protein [Aspergillus californicus]